MRLFKNQKGMSLVQVMMAAGMTGIVAVAVMNISQISNKTLSNAESGFETNSFINELDMRFKNSNICTDTFGGETIANQIPLDTLKRGTEDLFPVGTKVGLGKIEIVGYTLINDSVPISGGGRGMAFLQVSLRKSKASGGKVIRKRLPISLQVSTTAEIVRCNSDLAGMIEDIKTQVCADLGGEVSADGECINTNPVIGEDDGACNESYKGKLRFNNDLKYIEFCNGIDWTPMSGAVAGGGGGAGPT